MRFLQRLFDFGVTLRRLKQSNENIVISHYSVTVFPTQLGRAVIDAESEPRPMDFLPARLAPGNRPADRAGAAAVQPPRESRWRVGYRRVSPRLRRRAGHPQARRLQAGQALRAGQRRCSALRLGNVSGGDARRQCPDCGRVSRGHQTPARSDFNCQYAGTVRPR